MAYYDYYYSDYPQIQTPLLQQRPVQDVVQKRMLLILATVLLVIVPLLVSLRPSMAGSGAALTSEAASGGGSQAQEGEGISGSPLPAGPGTGQLSTVFTPEVRHWEPQILSWASTYGLDPNLVAIIMQIESCGDPQALSSAGAQGLFQVMPFHFAAGEDALDPETNARRGLSYFVERLNQTGGDVGRAFAGYNGGHVAAAGSWDDWLPETQRYYVWSTGIYQDIQAGRTDSATIRQWLQAGGASLCRQAATRLGI